MARELFDYNQASVNPLIYKPSTAPKKSNDINEEYVGDTGLTTNINKGFDSSVYDDATMYLSDYYNPNPMRASNQGGFTKIMTAIGKGAATGVLGAAEYAGYLGDVQEWLGADTDEVDVAYTNWLSEAAKEGKGKIEEAMPVYMSDPNALWDSGDIAGSVAKALGSTVDSAVSFGLLGLATGGLGAAALGAVAETVAGSALLRISTALAMNYTESKQMATDAIVNIKSALDEKLQRGEITEENYYKGLQNAAVEADKFIWKNKLNTWQDFLALRGLKNITAGTRALVKESTKASHVLGDMAGESFEEISSGFMQSEAEYNAKKSVGVVDNSQPKSAVDRAFKYAGSEQGIYEGILGAIGGPIQSYAFNKPVEKFITKKSHQDKVNRQAEQEDFYNRNKESILATAAKQKDTSDKMNKALEEGDVAGAAEYHAETFADLAFNNFKMGTTEKLEEHLDEVMKDEEVDPQLKEFVKQYKKDLPTYEKEYVKIVNRRKNEVAATKIGDADRLVKHANIASEFKLFVLKSHNENQIEAVNKEISNIDSKIASAGYLGNGTILADHHQTIESKNLEISARQELLKTNKSLSGEQKTNLRTQIKSLQNQVKELHKISKDSELEPGVVSAKVQNLLDDKSDLIKKRLDFETANLSFENQIQDVRNDVMTPAILEHLYSVQLASESLQASKSAVITADEVNKAGETAIENIDPDTLEIDKEKIAEEAKAAKAESVKVYTDTIMQRANEIASNEKLSTVAKINKLSELASSIESNWDLNPTENDKQALTLKDYVLKHKGEQLDIHTKTQKDDYIENSKKEKPKSEISKDALIKTPKFFTNSVISPTSKIEGLDTLDEKQLSELLKNVSREELNSKVELHVQRFPKKSDEDIAKDKNKAQDLKNGYYKPFGNIRNIIAVVYEGKILGYLYEPNKFSTLNKKTNQLEDVNFETLPDTEIRKLYPDGDIKALREAWKEAQDLQKFVSTIATDKFTVISNAQLQTINFKVDPLMPAYDMYNSITEWADLSSVSEAMITLADGSKTYVIYDAYREGTLSNYPSQVSELLSSLGEKQTPSKQLITDKQLKAQKLPTGKSRYAILIQLGNGTYEWVPVAPQQADTKGLFSEIFKTVSHAVKTDTKIDYTQFPFRNLFITTENGAVDVQLRYAEDGIIFTFEDRLGEGEKQIRIRKGDFNKLKSFEDLLTLLNKRLNPGVPSENYTPTTTDGKPLQLKVSDFRKSVIAGKEEVTETTDLTKDFVISTKPTIFTGVKNMGISSNVHTVEEIINEEPPAFNPNDPFRQAIAEPDFNNEVPEGAEVFTDEGEVVAEAKEEQPKEEPTSKPLTAKEKLAARQKAKAEKVSKGKDNEVESSENSTQVVSVEMEAVVAPLMEEHAEVITTAAKEDGVVGDANVKRYFYTQIINYVKGLSFNKSLEGVLKKAKRAIITAGVVVSTAFNLSTSTAIKEANLDNNPLMEYEEIVKNTPNTFLANQLPGELNNLSVEAKKVYFYNRKYSNSSYVIVDKPTATIYLIDEAGNLIKSLPGLIGADSGEGFKEGFAPNSYQQLSANGQRITPAGAFQTHFIEKSEYFQLPAFQLEGTSRGKFAVAFHATVIDPGRQAAESSKTSSDNNQTFGCISINQTDFKNYVVPNFKGSVKIYVTKKSQDSVAFKVNENTNSLNYNYDYTSAQNWLEERLPSSISVEDLRHVVGKLKVNGVPMGMLMNNILYLSQTAEAGTEYHEAFHAAFRLLSTDGEIAQMLTQARKEFKKPTTEQLTKLRNQASQNATLSAYELEDLFYEEKMADKFQDIMLGKTNTSWLGRLYNRVKSWLSFYTGNMDRIEATFYKLDKGIYKNSTIKANRFSSLEDFGTLKLLTKGVNEESNIRKTASSELSNKIIYTAAAWIGNELQKDNSIKNFEEQFNRFVDMMSSKYDWNNEEQADYYVKLMDAMTDDNQIQAFQDKVDEYYILYTDEGNRAIIYEQAEKLLKVFKVDSTEENEKEKLAEDVSERFDVDFFTLGGFDSMTAPVKEFIGLTLYETTDEFGNKFQSGVDFIKVYNGLTAALAGAEDHEMIPRMMQFKKHNPQTEAVVQKFIDAAGIMMSVDGKSHTFDESKSNEYYLLLNAFKKERVSFWTILWDAGTTANKKAVTRIIESNRKSSKQLQANNWASNFSSDFLRAKKDPNFKSSLISSLNAAIKIFELSKPLSEVEIQTLATELKNHLSVVGMTISQGYAEYSIAAYQVKSYPTAASDATTDIYEPFANSINSDLIISPTHLFEMREALNRGENIYAKEVTKDDLKTKKKKKSVGTFTRILKMSEGNTFFDENVIESTFTNAENQKVYNYLLRNQLMTKAKDFRDAGKRNALSNSKFINNLNHLLNFEHASNIFSTYNVALIDGIKPSVIDNVDDADSIKTMEGTTFGSMDNVQYLQSVLSFFGDQKQIKVGSEGKVINTAKYVFRQLEASNTGAIVELPVFDYFVVSKDGSLQVTDLFKEHLGNYIQQEWERIARETVEFQKRSRDIYQGYNDTEKGRAFKFWAFPQLNGEFSELAKTTVLDATTKAKMVNVMLTSLSEEYKDFKGMLSENKIIKPDGTMMIGDNLAYSTAEKWVGDFFTNDFLNSLGINQMYDGDYAVGRKDFLDMVKRHKGAIGYGIDMGEGFTNIVTVDDPLKYVDKGNLTSFSDLNNEEKDAIIASEIGRYLASNPEASDEDIALFKSKLDLHEIKVGDAQSYVTVEHVIAQLKRLGRFGKKVSEIYDKILEGKTITSAEVKILEKSRAALNSRKTVIFDGDVYYKLSEIPLSPSLLKTPGFEWHANLLKSMNAAKADQMVFASGSKLAKKNVVPFSEDGNFDFTKSVNPVQNKYKRLQVETPSGKETITAGTQLINLIVAEQNPDLIVNYRGQDVTIRELQKMYYQLLKDVRDVSFKSAAQFLVDANGKKDPRKAAKKFAETIESSGGSELQIRYFSPDENGNPKYNWNIAPIIEKAEELFLAHFNKAYSVQKVEGTKASLVSDVGVRVNGKALQWGKKSEDGKIWSECLMPRWMSELYGLSEGDEIPDEAAEMLGYRIPTQDKHSMVSLRVVGFLPNEYGSVIIVPKEVILLSGADFDIDSLYISRYSVFKNADKKLVRYGTATSIEDKYEEFKSYNMSDKNKDFKTLVRDFKLANAVLIKERMVETGKKKHEIVEEFYPIFFKSLGLPSTLEEFTEVTKGGTIDINKGALDNKILDAQMAMFNNPHIQDTIAKTPATMDSLKAIAKTVVTARTKAGSMVDSSKYNGFSIMGRYYAFVNNTEGKRNIGPTALSNVANAELTAQGLQYNYAPLINNPDVDLEQSDYAPLFRDGSYLLLSVNGKLVTGYSDTLDSNGVRKADSLSTVLSAMTDNAKEALANLVNLGLDIIPIVNHAITQGIDLESAILMVNTPDMLEYAKLKKETKRTGGKTVHISNVFNSVLRYTESLKLTEKETADIINPPLRVDNWSLTTELLQNLITLNPETTLKDPNIPREQKIDYLMFRSVILHALNSLDKQQAFIMNFTSIQALYKGSEVSFEDNERFINAINNLGLYKFFSDPKIANLYAPGNFLHRKVTDDTAGTFDMEPVFKNNPSLVALAENFSKINGPISQEYFISRTPTFNRVVRSMSPAVTAKERYQISRQLLTFLSTVVYKRKVASSPDNFMHKLMAELGSDTSFGGLIKTKDGVLTIGEELLDVKGALKNIGQRNYLLDRLDVLEDNVEMVTIEFPSMSKFNNAESNKLTDAFLELYTNDSTRDFSKKLFLYLFFKDNFKFKNNTFINNVADFMFKDYSSALDTIQEEFAKDVPDFSKLGYNSESEMFEVFAGTFVTDYNNKDILVTVSDLPIISNNALKDVMSLKTVKYSSGLIGQQLTINKEELRKYLRDNKIMNKNIRYVLNTLIKVEGKDSFAGIPGFISSVKDKAAKSYNGDPGFEKIVKSTFRLVADNDKDIIYAEMKQTGKKNLSPYAFKYSTLLKIAEMVGTKRDEAFVNSKLSKHFDPSVDNKITRELAPVNESEEVKETKTEDKPSFDPSINILSETGIIRTELMEPSPFQEDVASPESNNIQDFNPDNAPQGAVVLGDDDIKPDETGKKPCIK